MESETSDQRRHKGGHFSNYEAIPTHKNNVSTIFQEFIPRDKSFATHRASFSSNYVSDQMVMNFTKVKEFFSIIDKGRKTSFNFYTGVMVLEKCQNYSCYKRVSTFLK